MSSPLKILRKDLPDLCDEVLELAKSDEPLKEALCDYDHACSRQDDPNLSAEIRADWTEIRLEIVRELERRVRRMTSKATPNRRSR